MKFLVDTHLLVWLASEPDRLSLSARGILEDTESTLAFSAVSMWEIAIKKALGRSDFATDPRTLRTDLLDRDWLEVSMTSEHGFAAGDLLPIHRDPFDRALIAQAKIEGMAFLTADAMLARYGDPVKMV